MYHENELRYHRMIKKLPHINYIGTIRCDSGNRNWVRVMDTKIVNLDDISTMYLLHRLWNLNHPLRLYIHNCLAIVTSSAIDCDVISRTQTERVWHGYGVWKSSYVSSFMDYLCRVRNVYSVMNCLCVHSRFFWCLALSTLSTSRVYHRYSNSSSI